MAKDDDDRPLEIPIFKSKHLKDPKTSEHKQNVIRTLINNDQPTGFFEPRDPRFDSRCSGSDDRRHFVRNYSFLNGIKENEMKELEKALKKEHDSERKDKIKKTIVRYRNKMADLQRDTRPRKTNSRLKKVELAEKFKELKNTGKLTKYMERKRKKLIKRDRKA